MVAKPPADTVAVYGPGGSARNANRPSALVGWERVNLVSWFVTCTLAPTTMAPVGSVTVPWITPVVIWLWGKALIDTARISAASERPRMRGFMSLLLTV